MRKSNQVLKARNQFENRYGIDTLRALSALAQTENVVEASVKSGMSKTSLVTYKGNLTRGFYKEFVGPGFDGDKLNLQTCNR